MRILIYGFGPYRQFRSNVTGKILRRLPRRNGLRKIIFPVRFDRRQFTEALRRHQPDVVIGLGQCSRGRKLRSESRAVNLRRNRKEEAPREITRAGKAQIKTNLPIALGSQARRSHFAGDYVCNYSMYVILDFLARQQSGTRYTFIHIPHDYDERKATVLIDRAIARLIGQPSRNSRVRPAVRQSF